MQSRRVPTFATIVAAVYRRVNALALALPADSTFWARAPHRPLTEKADFRETIVVGSFVRALALFGRSRAQGPGHMERTRLRAVRRVGSAQVRSG